MVLPSLSRETALRIALAARALPNVEVGKMLDVIGVCVKGEINEHALATITVTDLKKGFTKDDGSVSDIPVEAIKVAVKTLWGDTNVAKLPTPVALESIPERSVRVAIASNTGEQLDGHFGSCIRFLVYQVSENMCQLIDIRSTVDASSAEDKNAYRTELIADCQVLYVVSVGGPAAAKVVRANIYPIKKPNGGEAGQILAELQGVMKNSPPPWLAKYFGDKAEDRIRYLREEESLVV